MKQNKHQNTVTNKRNIHKFMMYDEISAAHMTETNFYFLPRNSVQPMTIDQVFE